MKSGRIASLILWLATTILGAIVLVLSLRLGWLQINSSSAAFGAVGIFSVALLGLLFPLGIWLDRTLLALRTYIEDAALRSDPPAFSGPRWVHPIARAIIGAADQCRSREQALKNQLGDLEIRHRVSEAERRQVEAVLHSLRDAVLVTDAFNEIVMANEAAASVLGFDRSKALHKSIDGVIADKQLCRLINETRQTAAFGDARRVEHTLQAGGTPTPGTAGSVGLFQRVFEATLSCVENHKHEVGGVVTILHDLTRERELSQMKSDFVSKASHELRTPLSSIRAYVEMLVDGEANDENARNEFYKIIHNETDRLSRLIDNMLNISRIEAGIVQIERENVDIKSVCQRAASTLEPQAKEKNIDVSTRLAAVDLCVEGDADMLYQVVINLISNAVKYTPEGGRITVTADSDNLTRSVVVTVADTGLGIPPDSLPRLFDKFYRVENYKRVAKGTGLGLSLCKHIVETVHHGQIGVESKLGMGSRFWFAVPMRYVGSQAAA